MNKNVKRVAKLLLAIILIYYFYDPITDIVNWVAENTTYRSTYIYSVNMDSPEINAEVKKDLDFYNKLGDNKIVNYNGFRPVVIEQVKLDYKYLGLTLPEPLFCWVRVQKGLRGKELSDVLLHEYTHCYNVGHDLDPKDVGNLMSPIYMMPATLESIKAYAKYIEKEFYE